MKTFAYLDSSFFLGIILTERSAEKYQRLLHSFQIVTASTLLESEVLATLKREGLDSERASPLFDAIHWLTSSERLTRYLTIILETGYLRGADAHHLASALWYAQDRVAQCHFLTTDKDQASIAKKLGFIV